MKQADPSGMHTVLVVEDEPMIRFMIADELREAGLHVVETTCGDEAWNYIVHGHPVDLVFSDVRMPGQIDGLALAKQVRNQYPSILMVLTSGHLLEHDDASDDGPPCEIIRKPYDLSTVTAQIAARIFACGPSRN